VLDGEEGIVKVGRRGRVERGSAAAPGWVRRGGRGI